MSGGAAQLYEEDFVRSTEQPSRVLLGPIIEKQKPRVARLATLSLLGYGVTVKQLPLPSAQIHSVDAARRPLRAFPAKAGIHLCRGHRLSPV
jgi:hypothetical protein